MNGTDLVSCAFVVFDMSNGSIDPVNFCYQCVNCLIFVGQNLIMQVILLVYDRVLRDWW